MLGRAVTHGNVIGRHRKRECKRYPKRGKRRQEVELPEPSFDMRPTNPYAATLADEGEQRRLAPLGLQAGVGAHDADQLPRQQAHGLLKVCNETHECIQDQLDQATFANAVADRGEDSY